MEKASGASELLPLFSVVWSSKSFAISIELSFWVVIALVAFVFIILVFRWFSTGFAFRDFEIDQAEMGIGSGKVRLKPNLTDKQVAYAIWVELSTRKIGLPIDLEHDVIAEVYDSWYAFFSVTRDLLKTIPVNKVQNDSTRKIVSLSIEVLNQGLRPHLTHWQARFRYWYERELTRLQETKDDTLVDPQGLQTRFPEFMPLKQDMERVNKNLMNYREKMHQLIMRTDRIS